MSRFHKYSGVVLKKGEGGIRSSLSPGGTPPAQEKKNPRTARLITPKEMVISFPFDRGLKDRMKDGVPGRIWDPDKKQWRAPPSLPAIEWLRGEGFSLGKDLEELEGRFKEGYGEYADEIHPPDILRPLMPFQARGLSFLLSRNGRGLLADEMGLGKTIQALSYLEQEPDKLPALIVCPASLKENWRREIKMTLSRDPWTVCLSGRPTQGTRFEEVYEEAEIVIINYDILSSWEEALSSFPFKTLILDECHYIKNRKAKRSQAVKNIAGKIPHLISLSGTPVINRPVEFYEILHLLAPDLFSSWFQYAKQFCELSVGWGGTMDATGCSNPEELNSLLTKTVMLRRTKEEVLKDLPPKVRTVVPLEISERVRNQYRINAREIAEEVEQLDAAQALVEIEKLKQLVVDIKMSSALQWIKDFLECDGKLVIFATHTKTLDRIQDHFGKICVRLDGSTPTKDRPLIVDRFQKDPEIKLFLGNIKAAGTGLTLTATSSTCFLELGWTPGEHDQAEDRVHRIGQESDSVNAYYLLVSGTIEDEIAQLLDEKRKNLAGILDGKKVEKGEMLKELIKSLREGADLDKKKRRKG